MSRETSGNFRQLRLCTWGSEIGRLDSQCAVFFPGRLGGADGVHPQVIDLSLPTAVNTYVDKNK